ncbi:MAG: caspase domain-containing protein, partial [Cyanobacteriota bacterium]
WRTSTPGVAWLVNLSADGRFVVAALGDGTIRWYRTRSEGTAPPGSEALALFVHPDLKRWILWTPEGFYDASPGGAELFGYHLNNNSRDEPGTFISSAQLQQKFFRPDLISRRLSGQPEDEAIISSSVSEVGDVRTSLSTSSLPPVVRIVSQRTLPDGKTKINYVLIDRGGGIGAVQIRLNGAEIKGFANPPRPGLNTQTVALPPGRTRLTINAFGVSGHIASTAEQLVVASAAHSEPPTLHIVAVGITNYRDQDLRSGVRFAAGDARAFSDALVATGRAPTARVAAPVLLTDEQATGARIRQVLSDKANSVGPDDLFVLYMAGRGVGVDGEYIFLPQDLLYRSSDSLREGISGVELRTLLTRIPSTKTVVVLDTGSSGVFRFGGHSLDEKGAINRLSRLSGRVVLAAAGDQRMALESPDNQRGIFTGALIKALSGLADLNGDGLVGVHEVASYIQEEVGRVAMQQFGVYLTPWIEIRGHNFPLVRSGKR